MDGCVLLAYLGGKLEKAMLSVGYTISDIGQIHVDLISDGGLLDQGEMLWEVHVTTTLKPIGKWVTVLRKFPHENM